MEINLKDINTIEKFSDKNVYLRKKQILRNNKKTTCDSSLQYKNK